MGLYWGLTAGREVGAISKQEKGGWVAVAPTLRSQRRATPAAQGFFGFLGGNPLGGLQKKAVAKSRVARQNVPCLQGFCSIYALKRRRKSGSAKRKEKILALDVS